MKLELNSVSQIDGTGVATAVKFTLRHTALSAFAFVCVGSVAWVQCILIYTDFAFLLVLCVFLITSSTSAAAALHSAVNLEIAIKQPTAFWVCVALCARPTPKGSQLRQKITFSNKEINIFLFAALAGIFPLLFISAFLDTRAIKRQKVIIGLLAQRFDADGIGRELQ